MGEYVLMDDNVLRIVLHGKLSMAPSRLSAAFVIIAMYRVVSISSTFFLGRNEIIYMMVYAKGA